MSEHPISDEIGANLAAFVDSGAGPRHRDLTRVFSMSGYGLAAPYNPNSQTRQPSKVDRIRTTVSAATREPHRSLELIAGLLAEFRAHGFFDSVDPGSPNDGDPNTDPDLKIKIDRLRASFLRVDWELTPEGEIRPAGVGTVRSLDGRPAIDVQLARLRRAADDPSLLLGTAKEMLESTGKYVTEQFSVPLRPNTTFDELWHHARERLELLPQQVNVSAAGGKQVREILQSSWSIAQMTNQIRNDEGTGHGRTLPTAVTPEIAMMVVREACSVAEMVLSKLDRAMGRQR